jgi:hypothetical protein
LHRGLFRSRRFRHRRVYRPTRYYIRRSRARRLRYSRPVRRTPRLRYRHRRVYRPTRYYIRRSRSYYRRAKKYYRRARSYHRRYRYYRSRARRHYIAAKRYLHRGLFSRARSHYRKYKSYYRRAKKYYRRAKKYYIAAKKYLHRGLDLKKKAITYAAIAKYKTEKRKTQKAYKIADKPGIYTPYGYFRSTEEYQKFLLKKFPDLYGQTSKIFKEKFLKDPEFRKRYWANPEKVREEFRKKYAHLIEQDIKKLEQRWKEYRKKERAYVKAWSALPRDVRRKISVLINEKNKYLKAMVRARRAGDLKKAKEYAEKVKLIEVTIRKLEESYGVPPSPSMPLLSKDLERLRKKLGREKFLKYTPLAKEAVKQIKKAKYEEFKKNPVKYLLKVASEKEKLAERAKSPEAKVRLMSEAEKLREKAIKLATPTPVAPIPKYVAPRRLIVPKPKDIFATIAQKLGVEERYVRYAAYGIGGLIVLAIIIAIIKKIREEEYNPYYEIYA